MRANELVLKISEPKIEALVEEGYKVYDANGNLKRKNEDITHLPDIAVAGILRQNRHIIKYDFKHPVYRADLRNVCLLKTKMIQFIYRMIFHGNPPFPRCFHSIFLIIIPFPISFMALFGREPSISEVKVPSISKKAIFFIG